jgi:hypothetical protein
VNRDTPTNGGIPSREPDFDADEYDAEPTAASLDPDVLLDVPLLKVDEISLDVEDLRARVSLQADVLDLLNLSVGADVILGKVHLEIKGVEAQALLKVRLDRVADVINRVLTTIDRNPQVVERLTAGVGEAAAQLGHGAGGTLGELGRGAAKAVGEVGAGAGQTVGEVGRGAGRAVVDVGSEGGRAIRRAGETVGEAGQAVGRAEQTVGETGQAVKPAGRTMRDGGLGDGGAYEEGRDDAAESGGSRRREEPGPERPVRHRRSDADDRDDQARRRPRFPRESDRGSGRRPP